MPVVEKVKKTPAVPEEPAPVPEDISIEKPKARKPITDAMREAGRANLERGRATLAAKREAAKAAKPPTPAKPAASAEVPVAVLLSSKKNPLHHQRDNHLLPVLFNSPYRSFAGYNNK